MKLQTLIFAICLLFALPACMETEANRNFQKGVAAYDAGNYKIAVKWWRKAAEQGHAEAQFALGVRYALGEDVPKHEQKAYMWYLLAAANGDEETQEMTREHINLLELHLSRAEIIAAAQKEAAEMQAQIESRK